MPAPSLEHAVRLLARLPGLGPRSARRVVLHVLEGQRDLLSQLIDALQQVRDKIVACDVCGYFDETSPCAFCADARRKPDQVCVVAGQPDVGAVEKTRLYAGRYHVLGGVISALDGVKPEQLRLRALVDRVKTTGITEVILALPATVDGQTTATYLSKMLETEAPQAKITRLGIGVPMGGELDYLDGATLAAALKNRN